MAGGIERREQAALLHERSLPSTPYFPKAAIQAAAPYVRIFWLPRYTSATLNWIEGCWEKLKSTDFSCMLTADRDTFYDAVVRLLRHIRTRGRLPIRAATLNGIKSVGMA